MLSDFLGALVDAYAEDLRAERRAPNSDPRDYIYASGVRSCTRQMALDLLHPDEQEEWTDDRLANMKRGKEREKNLHIRLMQISDRCRMPFDVIEAQKQVDLRGHGGRHIMRGNLDAIIKRRDGTRLRYTCEIKSGLMADRIESLEDMERSEYTRHWVDQHLAYQLGLGIPEGFFFLDKPGMPLPIELRLEDDDHLERAEQFMQRAEAAVAARFNEAPLPGFTDNRELCLRCPHRGKSCAPPLDFGEGAVIITDERLIAAAYTHEATKADYDAYQDAHKILSKALRGVMLGTLGPYEIQGKWQSQTEYQLPADIEEAIDKIKEPFALLNPQGKYRFRLVRIDAKAEDGE